MSRTNSARAFIMMKLLSPCLAFAVRAVGFLSDKQFSLLSTLLYRLNVSSAASDSLSVGLHDEA
jgi:hypothetical protein